MMIVPLEMFVLGTAFEADWGCSVAQTIAAELVNYAFVGVAQRYHHTNVIQTNRVYIIIHKTSVQDFLIIIIVHNKGSTQ